MESLNSENRNFNLNVRCCSFCRRPGHNITTCNSERLVRFERLCIDKKNELNSLIPGYNLIHNSLFLDFLLEQATMDPNLVKAFAVRKCGATLGNNIETIIRSIDQYFRVEINHNINPRYIIEPPQQQIPEEQNAAVLILNDMRAEIPLRPEGSSTILDTILFIEMIMRMHRSNDLLSEKRFNIKTKILQNEKNLIDSCECNICYEQFEKIKFIKLDCGHEFCKDCIKNSLKNENKEVFSCAYCRNIVKNFEIRDENIMDELNNLIY